MEDKQLTQDLTLVSPASFVTPNILERSGSFAAVGTRQGATGVRHQPP